MIGFGLNPLRHKLPNGSVVLGSEVGKEDMLNVFCLPRLARVV